MQYPQHAANTSHRARQQWQLGQTHAKKGAWEAASKAFALAAKLAPNEAIYGLNLARAYMRLGDMRSAGDAAERVFRADLRNAMACGVWVQCLTSRKRHAEAVVALRMLHPDVPRDHDYHETLGRTLQFSGKPQEAIGAYCQALGIKLDLPFVHYQLGICFNDLNMKEQATECFRTALVLGIGNHELSVRGLLGHFESEVCRWEAAASQRELLIEALHALPDDAAVPTTPFVHVTLFDDPLDQLRAARSAARAMAAEVKPLPAPGPRPAGRRLRIGYVSCDFYQHATTILMAEMLEQHDRERFEVWLYSHSPNDGTAMRRRIEIASEHFVDVMQLGDVELAKRIRDDDIDLLIDLKGYTRDNRLSLFALRPGRVRASFLGFPGTSGADFIDYIVGDAVVTPLAHAAHFSEKIAQMPVCYQPNDRQRARPAPAPRSALGLPDDAVVLCGFNQPFKISSEVFDVWCRVLTRCPSSVLWLLEWNPQVRKNLELEAVKRGIDLSRIVWAPKLDPAPHMARLLQADLFIDTWPCNAHTTASDALWACVPVVTFMGNTFASRVAGSLNRAAGMQDLVCGNVADYEERIVQLAGDASARQALRDRLAANRDDCVLFDSRRFTLDIEALYVRMVERHDQGLAPEHLPAVEIAS
jgi:predicted O-linked N-acetylglucosamine transferase (SPINDLY family)